MRLFGRFDVQVSCFSEHSVSLYFCTKHVFAYFVLIPARRIANNDDPSLVEFLRGEILKLQALLELVGVITQDKIVIALDDAKTFATDGLYLFSTKEAIYEKYVMGVLNSRLFIFVYRLLALERRRVLAQVKPTLLSQLPIRTIDFDNPDDKARHDKMVKLVDRMLDLHKRLAKAKVPTEKTRIQRQINTTDSAIDKLTYELYNLTEEQIKIIEQSAT